MCLFQAATNNPVRLRDIAYAENYFAGMGWKGFKSRELHISPRTGCSVNFVLFSVHSNDHRSIKYQGMQATVATALQNHPGSCATVITDGKSEFPDINAHLERVVSSSDPQDW